MEGEAFDVHCSFCCFFCTFQHPLQNHFAPCCHSPFPPPSSHRGLLLLNRPNETQRVWPPKGPWGTHGALAMLIISAGEPEASDNECSLRVPREFCHRASSSFLARRPRKRALTGLWGAGGRGGELILSSIERGLQRGCSYHSPSSPARSGSLERSSLGRFPLHVSFMARTLQIWPYNELSV